MPRHSLAVLPPRRPQRRLLPALSSNALAIATSLAAPSLAASLEPALSLRQVNGMVLIAYGVAHLACILAPTLSAAHDGERIGPSSIWPPMRMAMATCWLLPLAADGASPAQMLWRMAQSLV